MKKVLLATTALIVAGAFAGPGVAKADLEVTVGGFAAFQAAVFDNDNANATTREFQSESQISVHADATADNGLQYGAKVTLDTSTNDSTNSRDSSVYLAGGWGRVVMGDELQAGRSLAVFAPTVGIGQINGSYDDFVPSADRGHLLNDRGDATFLALDGIRSTNITYFTPKFSGFQAGISYVPEMSNMGESVVTLDTTSAARNVFEAGLNYTGEFSGVGVKVGGQFNMGDAQSGNEDMRTWGLGGQLSYAGFRFGGSYDSQGDSLSPDGTADDNIHSWNVGATYENGPWGVGISYLSVDFDTNGDPAGTFGSDTNGGTYEALALGGTYKVAPGLTAGADLAFFDRDRDSGTDTDGYVLMTDVTAAF